jgi:hypothetical protein
MNCVEPLPSAATLLHMRLPFFSVRHVLPIYGDILDMKFLEGIFETVINFSICAHSWNSVYCGFKRLHWNLSGHYIF